MQRFRDEKIRNDAKTSGQEGTFAGCFERMTFIPNDGLSTETLETIQKFTINEGQVDALCHQGYGLESESRI
jgi:hypothetical protein